MTRIQDRRKARFRGVSEQAPSPPNAASREEQWQGCLPISTRLGYRMMSFLSFKGNRERTELHERFTCLAFSPCTYRLSLGYRVPTEQLLLQSLTNNTGAALQIRRTAPLEELPTSHAKPPFHKLKGKRHRSGLCQSNFLQATNVLATNHGSLRTSAILSHLQPAKGQALPYPAPRSWTLGTALKAFSPAA